MARDQTKDQKLIYRGLGRRDKIRVTITLAISRSAVRGSGERDPHR